MINVGRYQGTWVPRNASHRMICKQHRSRQSRPHRRPTEGAAGHLQQLILHQESAAAFMSAHLLSLIVLDWDYSATPRWV